MKCLFVLSILYVFSCVFVAPQTDDEHEEDEEDLDLNMATSEKQVEKETKFNISVSGGNQIAQEFDSFSKEMYTKINIFF